MEKKFLNLGIIGKPLSHSISPILQNIAIKSIGKLGEYKKFECEDYEIPNIIKYVKSNNYSGFNVTIPHKQNIIKYLDIIDKNAQKIGAVNTVKIENNKLIGYNTDITGFIEPIKHKRFNNATVLGAGGAARAVVFGLSELNVQNITVCARNIDKGLFFVNSIRDKINKNFDIKKLDEDMDVSSSDIIINCTPCGMKGEFENISPLNLQKTKKEAFVYDIVYNPIETKLLKLAKEKNLECINGLDMLVFQGVKAFEIWSGETPDVNMMKRAVLEYFL